MIIDSISKDWVEKVDSKVKILYWSYKGFIEEKENFELSPSKFPSDLAQSILNSGGDFMKKTKYLNSQL